MPGEGLKVQSYNMIKELGEYDVREKRKEYFKDICNGVEKGEVGSIFVILKILERVIILRERSK